MDEFWVGEAVNLTKPRKYPNFYYFLLFVSVRGYIVRYIVGYVCMYKVSHFYVVG